MPVSYAHAIREAELIVVRNAAGRIDLNAQPRRAARARLPEPRVRLATGLESGLSAATVALTLLIVWALWQWHKTAMRAETAEHEARLSWTFSDSVLTELKGARDDAERLNADRKDLVQALREEQAQGESLKQKLEQWQDTHRELKAQSEQALAQWTDYSRSLETNLGGARMELVSTSERLQQERAAAQQSLAELNQAKSRVELRAAGLENEATALAQRARSLDSENSNLAGEITRLGAEISRLRGCIGSLETERNILASRNNCLENEKSQLANEVRCLHGRICSLEATIKRLEGQTSQRSIDSLAHRR